MKGILVILDGLGDLAYKQLDGKSPLEKAEMPNLSFLTNRGEMGFMYPVRPGFIPESDEAIMSLFGNSFDSSSRGQLEAVGAGIKLTRGDLALRTNFATIDSYDKGVIIDRRVGRTLTTKEAGELAKEINKKVKLNCKFIFKPTIQHRGVLVLKGGFSDNITDNDITYYQNGRINMADKIEPCKPLDETDNAQYTANILNEFLMKSYGVLDKHRINEIRRKKGLLPANYILTRSGGIENSQLNIYKNWISIAYMPLEIGFSKLSGMNVFTFDYPKSKKNDIYENLYEGLREVCRFSSRILEKNYQKADYAYIHIKETDIPGHDNRPLDKIRMLEYIDKTLFKFLVNFAPSKKIHVVITGDHSTPCILKSHSADPVPVLWYNCSLPKQNKKFCEKNARLGKLGRIEGKDLLKKVGFDSK